MGNKVWVYYNASWKGKMLVSICAATSRRIGWSFHWKQVTNAIAFRARHPKKVGVASWTIEGRASPLNKKVKWHDDEPNDPP